MKAQRRSASRRMLQMKLGSFTPMTIRTVFAALAVLAISAGAAQAASGTLTVYTSTPDQAMNDLIAAFNKAEPGVKVDFFRSGTTEVVNKLQAEFTAGAPAARRAVHRRRDHHGAAEGRRAPDVLCRGAGAGPARRVLRCGHDLFRHQDHPDRHRLQHQVRQAAPGLLGRPDLAECQGPGDHAEPALFRCGGDPCRHRHCAAGAQLELLREARR